MGLSIKARTARGSLIAGAARKARTTAGLPSKVLATAGLLIVTRTNGEFI